MAKGGGQTPPPPRLLQLAEQPPQVAEALPHFGEVDGLQHAGRLDTGKIDRLKTEGVQQVLRAQEITFITNL